MRAVASASHQTLSPEAASVLKHSLSLARRRGHAQVTPLHVAATLLTARASLLRRACLKSQPHQTHHPLQCRALELCFNVALNRLPAAPGSLLHAQPSLSNALVAALKRAQAHQRRGCVEQPHQQQQPLIAIKVELEQLVLSILDDPSVSRVMREAGFNSTCVKNNLEDSSTLSSVFHSGGIYSTPSSPPTDINPTTLWHSHLLSYAYEQNPNPKEDLNVVMEVLVGKKRRNTVILSDISSTAEALVTELMGKLEREEVPDELKSTQLIKFQFSSVPLMLMNKDEVNMNVADLKRKVEGLASGGRVIIYIGDLKWAVEREGDEREGDEREGRFCSYNPVNHLIAEIGKLISWYNNSSMRVWLMASANYQTYMKCQMKQPPLDVQWALQAVSVPSGGPGLSLNATSGRDPRISLSEHSSPVSDKKLFFVKEEADGLTCCPECISSYEKEAALPKLPFWLNSHANGSLHKEDIDQLRRKYNKLCQNLHQGSQNPHNSSTIITNQSYFARNNTCTSSYPSWPNKNYILSDSETISFAHPPIKPNQGPSPSSLPRFRRQQSCHIEFSFTSKNQPNEPIFDSLKGMEDKEERITLALGNSMYSGTQNRDKIVDLCDIVKDNVPWQSDSIPLIMEALKDDNGGNQDKLILIQGNDVIGKRRLALAIAESMFGSSDLLVCVSMRENGDKKEMVERALRNHEKIVVLVEGVEFADQEFVKFLCDGFEAGKIEMWGRKKSDSSNAMFVLTTDGDINYNKKREDRNYVIQMKLLVHESKHGLNLDHKRKAEWDLVEEVSSMAIKNGKREFKRLISSNGLDLNVKAEEDEAKPSDIEHHTSLTFLKKIKNRFVFNQSLDQDKQARAMLLSKMKRDVKASNFDIEEKVLEEILRGAGSYLNGLFEEWVNDVFQTSLRGVNSGEREKVSFRLCLVGKGESCAKDGFMGTCLPKRIPICYIG